MAPPTLRPARRTPGSRPPEDFRKEDFLSSQLHLLIRPLGKASSQAAPRTAGAEAPGRSLSLSVQGEGTSRASRQHPRCSPRCSRHLGGIVTNRDEIPAPRAWHSNRADRRSRRAHPERALSGARGQAESKALEGQSGGWHPGARGNEAEQAVGYKSGRWKVPGEEIPGRNMGGKSPRPGPDGRAGGPVCRGAGPGPQGWGQGGNLTGSWGWGALVRRGPDLTHMVTGTLAEAEEIRLGVGLRVPRGPCRGPAPVTLGDLGSMGHSSEVGGSGSR